MAIKTPEKTSKPGGIPKVSGPANSALELAGYTQLKQLTKVTEKDILKLHGVGLKGIRILKEALQAQGWSFKAEKNK